MFLKKGLDDKYSINGWVMSEPLTRQVGLEIIFIIIACSPKTASNSLIQEVKEGSQVHIKHNTYKEKSTREEKK